MSKLSNSGILYVVSTPIGNLEDITFRAVRILGEVDLIAAEDTRKARRLLTHFQIETPTTSFFEGNEKSKTAQLISQIETGKSIAIISEAGTPLISDPGFRLIREAINNEIQIVPIPGATACIAAISVSGLPIHNFAFEGFLSQKSGKRRRRLIEIQNETRTLIFYESPYRVLKFLIDALEILGDRQICVCRELTKKFEEIFRGKISEAIAHFDQNTPRGEFTIVIGSLEKF